jgi:hypothetical protein
VALVISPDATLTVRAPMRLPLYFIEQMVSRKMSWIRKIINDIQTRPKIKPKEFVNGEEFLFLGKSFKLKVVDDAQISLGEELCFPKSMLCNASENLIAWYKNEARQKIEELAVAHARQMQVEYKSIAITGAKKRWGSCTRKAGLNFSWRLAMAPLEVIDYVVVHEMTHLREMNHSGRFWCHVKTLFPDYKKHVKWLRANDSLMHI